MRAVTDLPRHVRELPHIEIPVRDGARLAARVWLPEDAEDDPVPAILEAIPYRKSDWTWARDAVRHPYTAGHGYAVVRLDLRGSGDSEGVLTDEYLAQEQDDLVDVIAWLAARSWCTGAVGMTGISWGGFNALQVAARRPPALRAIMTLCSTDDRYADDVHFMGGCVLGVDMLPWAAQMLVWQAAPPDPANVGERWRALWNERLVGTPPYVEAWLAQQRRDAYWRHGSVCEDFAAIECPVYAIGGWVDGYRSAVLRLLAGLSCPRKGLIGPWAHSFPDDALPGPTIGFNREALRWWDRWLKGMDTGVMDEPQLRVWMQEPVAPAAELTVRPGRWVAEGSWPSPRIERRAWALSDSTLVPRDDTPSSTPAAPAGRPRPRIRGTQTCGLDAGLWCPYGDALDQPGDQRADDGLSLTFTSQPLEEDVEILGCPEVRVTVASDRPVALVAARLCDVAPDGASSLVTSGLLNLTHREGHDRVLSLEPGRAYEVTVTLRAIAHAFRTGQRIRLAISPTYWPWAWPSPEPVELTVDTAASELVLPVRPPRPEDTELRPFAEPEGSPELLVEVLTPGETSRTIHRDLASGRVVLDYAYGGELRRLPNGTELCDRYRETFAIVEDDPLSARVRCEHSVALGRGDWRTEVDARTEMWSDAESFHVVSEVEAREGAQVVHTSRRQAAVPRDGV